MDTPTAPITPLGARTPHAHPGLYAVIATLSLIILVGAAWVFWPRGGVTPGPAASPSASLPSTAAALEYRVSEYGLSVKLPESWRGFKDVSPGMDWAAYSVASGNAVDSGPSVVLQHPEWSMEVQRQNIPIMVFTPEQWGHVSGPDADWSVSAAPVAPTELARNSRFIFALPARYNYAYPEGWEEVDELIRNGAVTTFETCQQRPACLDSTPRCLLPEPAEGWCRR